MNSRDVFNCAVALDLYETSKSLTTEQNNKLNIKLQRSKIFKREQKLPK